MVSTWSKPRHVQNLAFFSPSNFFLYIALTVLKPTFMRPCDTLEDYWTAVGFPDYFIQKIISATILTFLGTSLSGISNIN